ncbi:conserved hypothetical protein [Burkholderiales bacterium 8X]|nr:conserved hypothetical protein [Burkholderiales bacterium 8X]
MIQLKVLSLRGVPIDRDISAVFDAAGGTIGRASTNTMVLADPDHTVSRVHAEIRFGNGRYAIVDRGTNPLQHNGVPVGRGREVPLALGDHLGVGSFELCVEADASRSTPTGEPAGLLDDPFGDLMEGLGPAAPGARPNAEPSDPFDGLLGDDVAPSGASQPDTPVGAGHFEEGAFGIPPLRIDDLFGGLGGADQSGGGGSSAFEDPLPLRPAAAQQIPGGAFGVIGLPPHPSAESRGDHLPIDRFGFTPPNASTPKLAEAEEPPVRPPRAPERRREAHERTAADSDLLAAFVRGLGGTHPGPDALTPELMERIGLLLRTSTEGTLQLLQARQELKREVKAEVTMIAAQANNPLKFSPSAESALAHLLGPGMRGFMSPEAAMKDAYDDLRAHEFGMMVGMRAALAHVVTRFSPASLEQKIESRGALDSLFAANRKAKLWDQFVALYGGIAAEAEDDFHTLFGKAFLQAYEEQMARLASSR